MKALIFDTETNGKPKAFNAPMSEVNNWPRITQLAWQHVDLETGEVLSERQNLILPDGWTIPTVEQQMANGEKNPNFFADNNMSTERCFEEGVPIAGELSALIEVMNDSDILVAHNVDFDVNVVGSEMIRLDMSAEKRIKRICTMKLSTNFCQLPSLYRGQQYKWPSLIELHRILFNEDFVGAHDAMDDVNACRRCLIELIKREIIIIK